MKDSYTYPLQIRWNAPRGGIVESREDNLPSLTVASPPEFGGPEQTWSPEHMFVASVASCFMTTLLAIAELSKLEIRAFEADAGRGLHRALARRRNGLDRPATGLPGVPQDLRGGLHEFCANCGEKLKMISWNVDVLR